MQKNINIGIYVSLFLALSITFQVTCKSKKNKITPITPKLTIRSQGTNAVRRIIDSVDHLYLPNMKNIYGTFSIVPEYTRSFDRRQLAKCLFGNKLCDDRLLRVQGSRVENRDENALLADYFYLPTDFSSEIDVYPLIQNFIIDFNFYLGLDKVYPGLYFWLQAPLVWSSWQLSLNECIKEKGRNDHDEGYFTINSIDRDVLLNSFSEYANGASIGINSKLQQTATKSGSEQTIGFTFNGLQCSKICKDNNTKTTISELRFAFGYNFLLNEDYHFGVNVQASVPTGNNVKSEFLFAVQNGNDNHWELGVGINGHYVIKRAEPGAKHFGLYFDANITHLFKNNQCRCFDLCDKPLSRYMLAMQMKNIQNNNPDDLEGEGVAARYQFNNVYTPVANLTTFDVSVSVGVQADIIAMFNYSGDDWSWDFGYNFWGRSCEQISLNKICNQFEGNTWALKGDAHVFGYTGINPATGISDNDFVALSASMSKAEICGGNNFGTQGAIATNSITAGKKNPGIDHPKNATAGNIPLNISRSSANQIKTSIQPILIKQSDVNFTRTKGISHKLFTHASYTWPNKENWIPYFGTGFELEWASDQNNTCKKSKCCTDFDFTYKNNCTTKTNGNCVTCGLSQWGYWIKAGISFY